MMIRPLYGLLALILAGSCSGNLENSTTFDKPEPVGGLDSIEFVPGPNGVRAWLIEEHSIPVIAMRMAWRTGESSDPDGTEGVTEFLAYMMNEGAASLDSDAFARKMQKLNMSFGCSSSADWFGCSMTTLSHNSQQAFDMVADAIREPRFDRAPLERAIREKLVELSQARTQPGWITARAIDAALRPDHPYSRYPTPQSIKKIRPEHLFARRKAVMAHDSLLIAVVGDIEPDELSIALENIFGSLEPVSSAAAIPEVNLQNPPPEPISHFLPRPQTLISFYAPGPKRNDPDFMAAYVLNHILGGGGFSSRLMDQIREKRGLTYGIRTSLSTLLHGGMWTGQTQTQNETVDTVLSLIKSEIKRLNRNGPTEKERQDAIAYLTGAYPLGFDSNHNIAGQLMYAQQYALGANYFTRRNNLVRAVSMDDLNRTARKWLDPDAFTFVLAGGRQNQQ